jgi:hypothetical protein
MWSKPKPWISQKPQSEQQFINVAIHQVWVGTLIVPCFSSNETMETRRHFQCPRRNRRFRWFSPHLSSARTSYTAHGFPDGSGATSIDELTTWVHRTERIPHLNSRITSSININIPTLDKSIALTMWQFWNNCWSLLEDSYSHEPLALPWFHLKFVAPFDKSNHVGRLLFRMTIRASSLFHFLKSFTSDSLLPVPERHSFCHWRHPSHISNPPILLITRFLFRECTVPSRNSKSVPVRERYIPWKDLSCKTLFEIFERITGDATANDRFSMKTTGVTLPQTSPQKTVDNEFRKQLVIIWWLWGKWSFSKMNLNSSG